MGKVIDLTSQKFGRLTVIKRVENDKYNNAVWLCECDCGNCIKVSTNSLRRKNTTSCGCFFKEQLIKRNIKHLSCEDRLYKVWLGMKERCNNKNNKNYGGRGIKVCDEWKNNYLTFKKWSLKNGYDKNKSRKEQVLDRINNNGNYEPNNCRWTTQKMNCRNKRNNSFVTINDKTKILSEWSEELNVNISTLYHRIHRKKNKKEEI